MRDPLRLPLGELMKNRFAIVATDERGARWFAVHEPMFGGWCAMTRPDLGIRQDDGDTHTQARANVLLPIVQGALSKFEWSVAKFR